MVLPFRNLLLICSVSAALDSGVAVSAILIFFCLQYPDNNGIGANTIQTWWGNTVATRTADYGVKGAGTPLMAVPPGSTFGYVYGLILVLDIEC